MTKEEKKEVRTLRHKLQKVAARHMDVNARLHMTGAQVKAAGRVLCDRILSGQDPTTVVPIA